jgi:class 3 adenylate cyclase
MGQRRQKKQQGLGQIRSVAMLFANMGNLTPITESRAAFDGISILNRSFTTLNQAITRRWLPEWTSSNASPPSRA